jgi:hypothetical protein
MSVARSIRIGALLLVLVAVAVGEWRTWRALQAWDDPLWVGIYPMAADDSDAVAAWIGRLAADDFAGMEAWLAGQGRNWDIGVATPFRLVLGDPIPTLPPEPPPSGALATAAWSLRMRAWSRARLNEQTGPRPDIALYVLYHDPERLPVLPHSLGLRKGRFGIVHAYASPEMRGSNRIVMVHELLHVVGATDKYDPQNGRPLYPDGYADPDRRPRYPQSQAEIMGGRVPISASEARIPDSLEQAVVGPRSAGEIGWTEPRPGA